MKALKAQAKNLHAALKARGIKEPLSYAQELLAAQYGQHNWDTLCGIASAKATQAVAPLRMADCGPPPDMILVEIGPHTYSANVVQWEEELVVLADSRQTLEQYLADHSERYPDGMDTTVITMEAEGSQLMVTADELVRGSIQRLGGKDYVHLPVTDWYLQLVYTSIPSRSAQAPVESLPIPEVSRSVKGVKLITLTSTDGPEWNLQLLVPPHLDAEAVAERVRAELKRLHELDAAHEDDSEYAEYTSEDLQRFVATLGCALMWPVKTIGPWD